jgi:aspartate/methionine/tyrosine aminotransferase
MKPINSTLQAFAPYASKAISQRAKADPAILDLSIGEPEFGPPSHLLDAIDAEDLSLPAFLASVKTYQQSRGSARLRRAIAGWYRRRYGIDVDPEREVLVTHGGVEAISLAVLACTEPADRVAITDPSYTLYGRALRTLGREPVGFERPAAAMEFSTLVDGNAALRHDLGGCRALIVNSPENPTGYVLDRAEWPRLIDLADRNGAWIIHDEVYDTMACARPHMPVRAAPGGAGHSILVNSLSKKFGVPGLRIGWMVAPAAVIDAASKAHDLLILGVNSLAERVAARLLEDPRADGWLGEQSAVLAARAAHARTRLQPDGGFDWPRERMGGMFMFPSVAGLCARLPQEYRQASATAGEAVADYLLREQRIAAVPGVVYGMQSRDHIRIMLSTAADTFAQAIDRLARLAFQDEAIK